MKKDSIHPGPVCAALAFLGTFVFFQFAYPYHLMRREQLDLFLFDGDYIRQTYRGAGWLARFAGDFVEQFFLLPVAGPVVIALLLTAVGAVGYRICRPFLGRWSSLGVAAVLFVWAFLRETSNIYMTRYTLATLGFLLLILLIQQFRSVIIRLLLLAFGVWALGAPFHPQNGKLWSVPKLDDERMIGLDVEVSRERWDQVLKLSEKDLYMEEASYCYNLALAMKGGLGEGLFNHSQNHQLTLLFPVSSERTIFTNSLAGEAWFHLGDMTTAEQSAITSLQASPRHTGARFLVRLARVGLVTGEDATAQKYLGMLDKTLFYRKWARSVMPGSREEAVSAEFAAARTKLARKDFVHQGENPRSVLLALLEADPENELARDYLLCYDLLCYDLDNFMADYVPEMPPDRLYHEAILIWLSRNSRLNPEQVARYGVDVSMVDRMGRFGRNPGGYKNTYWYYYLKALNGQ